MIKKELLTGFYCLVALLLLNASAADKLNKEEMMTFDFGLLDEIQGWSAKNKINPNRLEQRYINLNKSFCRGSRGAVFSKRATLAAGGKKHVKK